MEKSKTKIRQILCWCKKRKTLLAFLAVMLFLSVSAAVIAYTKTAWPEAEDNHVIVRMTDPNGAEIARMAIKAKTTWKTSYGNKTKENFNAQKLTINLSKISSSGNIKLLNSSAVKKKNLTVLNLVCSIMFLHTFIDLVELLLNVVMDIFILQMILRLVIHQPIVGLQLNIKYI